MWEVVLFSPGGLEVRSPMVGADTVGGGHGGWELQGKAHHAGSTHMERFIRKGKEESGQGLRREEREGEKERMCRKTS